MALLFGGWMLAASSTGAQPANDECESATVIVAAALPFTDEISTVAATTSPTDPLQSCNATGPAQHSRSVWYRFTATMDALLIADTFDSNYDTVLTAHSGTCGDLEEITCNEDTAGRQSRISLRVETGETVYFEVTSFEPDSGQLRFHLISTPGLTNDDCAAALVVAELPFSSTLDTSTATTEPTDPIQPCTPDGPARNTYSVWYRYTLPPAATGPRSLVINTSGTDYENVLSVYTGGCGVLNAIACDSSFRSSQAIVDVNPGQTVLIEVTHAPFFDPPGGGRLTLNIADEIPLNDECGSATEITSSQFQHTTYTAGANSTPSDPFQECIGTTRNTNSVWYRFTPQEDVSIHVATIGSDYDTVLSAYRGNCADLEALACNDDSEERASRVTFPAEQGETIYIEVTDFSEQPGGGNLRLQFETGPTATPGPSPTPTPEICAGDCDLDGEVTAPELVFLVNIALGHGEVVWCKPADQNYDEAIQIDEILLAVDSSLVSCR